MKNKRKSDSFDKIHKKSLSKDDMRYFERKPKGRFSWVAVLVIIFLAMLATVTVIGFYVFSFSRSGEIEDNISFKFEVLEKITSGDIVTLILIYENNSNQDLEKAEISLDFPDNFYFIESSMSMNSEYQNSWDIGELKSGESGTLDITGKLIGPVGDFKNFEATFVYQPDNFSYDFEITSSQSVLIKDSILSLEVKLPDKVTSGQIIDYLMKIKNTSDDSLNKVRLIVELPSQYDIESSTPEISSVTGNSWLFDELDAAEEIEIKVTGLLEGNKGDYVNFKSQLGMVEDNNEFALQQEESNTMLIVEPEVGLDFKINNASEDFAVLPGDKLDYLIKIKNNSDLAISNLVISFEFVQKAIDKKFALLDFSTLEDGSNGELVGEKIIWDSKGNSNFSFLAPNKEIELSFSINIRDSFSIKNSDHKNFLIENLLKLESMDVDGLEDGAKINFPESKITTKINSEIEIDAMGRYYDKELKTVGSGPHPPEVGKKTVYQVVFELFNTTSNLKDIKLTAKLSEDVAWYSEASVSNGEDLDCDPKKREISWQINELPANSGYLHTAPLAMFKVSVKPTKDDIGKVLTLVESIEVTAEDSFTLQKISNQANKITTKLEGDDLASGSGKVRK